MFVRWLGKQSASIQIYYQQLRGKQTVSGWYWQILKVAVSDMKGWHGAIPSLVLALQKLWYVLKTHPWENHDYCQCKNADYYPIYIFQL